jgi:hypothetical protein
MHFFKALSPGAFGEGGRLTPPGPFSKLESAFAGFYKTLSELQETLDPVICP